MSQSATKIYHTEGKNFSAVAIGSAQYLGYCMRGGQYLIPVTVSDLLSTSAERDSTIFCPKFFLNILKFCIFLSLNMQTKIFKIFPYY